MRRVTTSWRMIDEVLCENAHSVFRSLRGPATGAAVQRLAGDLPWRLPGDFRQSLACHDGLRNSYLGPVRLFNYWALLPVSAILGERRVQRDVQAMCDFPGGGRRMQDRRVKHDLRWREGWVPFMDADGDKLVIDLDPGPEGRVGQIVKFYNAQNERHVLAPSFGAWLSFLADRLTARQFRLDEFGGIWFDDLLLG